MRSSPCWPGRQCPKATGFSVSTSRSMGPTKAIPPYVRRRPVSRNWFRSWPTPKPWPPTSGYSGAASGAYFGLLACRGFPLEQALFLSPVVDMERLIGNMMGWFQVTPSSWKQRGKFHPYGPNPVLGLLLLCKGPSHGPVGCPDCHPVQLPGYPKRAGGGACLCPAVLLRFAGSGRRGALFPHPPAAWPSIGIGCHVISSRSSLKGKRAPVSTGALLLRLGPLVSYCMK